MKILLATSRAVPSGGGIASYNQELVSLLGKDNEIYLLTDSDEHDVPGYKESFSTYGNSNQDFSYCTKLINNINNSIYDYIINSTSSFIPVIAPFLNRPIIGISHFVNGKFAFNAGYNSEYIARIVALSKQGKKFIENRFNIRDSKKVQVVYNFVRSNNAPDTKKISRSTIRIVYPGGTSISKSVDVIQELVYKLISSDLDFEFYWLGGTKLPSAKFSIFGLRETHSLFKDDTRLIITGNLPRNEAMSIIESANIFLLPSRGEGCPMTLLEAMRPGCIPVISDAKHGSLDVIEAGKCGFITRQGSVNSLFDTVKDIIVNHDRYKDIYRKSFDFLHDELSQEKWAERMQSIFDEASNTQKGIVPLTESNFNRSAKKFNRINHSEDIKLTMRSALFRLKFDFSYFKYRIGLY